MGRQTNSRTPGGWNIRRGKLAGQHELYPEVRLPGRVNRAGEESDMDNGSSTTIVQKTVKSGITFGSALAMVISYTTWHSVGWAIFHGLLSWVYVIYFILRY